MCLIIGQGCTLPKMIINRQGYIVPKKGRNANTYTCKMAGIVQDNQIVRRVGTITKQDAVIYSLKLVKHRKMGRPNNWTGCT